MVELKTENRNREKSISDYFKDYIVGLLVLISFTGVTFLFNSFLETRRNIRVLEDEIWAAIADMPPHGEQATLTVINDTPATPIAPPTFIINESGEISGIGSVQSEIVPYEITEDTLPVVNLPHHTPLNDMINISGGNWRMASVTTDNFGNEYGTVMEPPFNGNPDRIAGFTSSFEAILGGNYSVFEGTVFVRQGETSSDTASFSIYLDDNVIFAYQGIDRRTEPIDFDLDVRGGNILVIRVGDTRHFPIYFGDNFLVREY